MSETKLLEMTNITKAFASNVVLNGVNLSVDEGEVVAILGENGAGKSTLMRVICGIFEQYLVAFIRQIPEKSVCMEL